MEDNNKNNSMWIWIIVVVIAALVVWMLVGKKGDVDDVDTGTETADVLEGEEDTTEGSVNVGIPAATISYQEALVKYKDARLQLDRTCQGSPDKMTFKNGTTIMVDNRAPATRTVKVGSTFSIKGWGFKLVKLESSTVPATWLVDCTESESVRSQNAATILIQG